MFYEYLAAKGQVIILFNCTLAENFVDCGCAIFWTKQSMALFNNKNLINNGRKIMVPKNLEIVTYVRLLDSQDNIRLFFENPS